MIDISEVADNADFIVNGYAFSAAGEYFRVLNLNHTDRAVVLDRSGEVIETSMDDAEISIVQEYFHRNIKYAEADIKYAQIL